MRLAGIILACVFATPAVSAQLTSDQKRLFVAFASAVSSGDPKMIQAAREYVEVPPNTLETIGFYGLVDAPAPSRSLRGIISQLGNHEFLVEHDPEFTLLDFEPLMREYSAFSNDHSVPDLLEGMPVDEWSDDTRADAALALKTSVSRFAHAANSEIAAQGRVVLEVTLPSDDLMLYWVTTPEVAVDWHCVLLLSEPDLYRPLVTRDVVVRPINWTAFYEMTMWSVGLDPDQYGVGPDVPDNTCPAA